MKRFVLACAATLALAPAARAEETPVDHYRSGSISLVQGMDYVAIGGGPGGFSGLSTQFGNGSAVGIVGLGVSARGVYQGFTFGGEFSVGYLDRFTPNAILFPGVSIGYAIPLTERLALTPGFRANFVVSTAPRSAAIAELMGEVALEVFLGKHGFLEPVIAMGDFQDTGAGTSGQATFVFGVGYRLGVTF